MKSLTAIIQHGMTLLAGFALAWLVLPQISGETALAGDTNRDLPAQVASDVLIAQEQVNNQIYNATAPSVVSIVLAVRQNTSSPFTEIGSGSGFVIDTQGHIVTNAHVIDAGAALRQLSEDRSTAESRVEIRMFDGTMAQAQIVGVDPDSDLAVLRVNVAADRLRPVRFANSENLQIGQAVFALGNPFSNDWTMTSGIISALNRSIIGLDGFSIGGVIQTDAAINPGNSGGPLVDRSGAVVGVNSQIDSEVRSNSGIGFAVPSNLVLKVTRALINDGSIAYSFIGIQSRPLDLALIEAYGLPDNLRGVAVLRTFADTPASDAGVRGISNRSVDIITAIDGRPIADFDELIGYLALNTVPGQQTTLTVYRDGNIFDTVVTLTTRPE